MNNQVYCRYLHGRGACREAREWIANQPESTMQQLWDACPRADWMYWVLCMEMADLKAIDRYFEYTVPHSGRFLCIYEACDRGVITAQAIRELYPTPPEPVYKDLWHQLRYALVA